MADESVITFRTASNRDADNVRELVFGVLEEFGLRPDRTGTDSDLDDIERNYLQRGGVFELLELNGRIVGSVGLYPIDDSVVELRKMYFLPEIRGRGLGRSTLERMIEKARELGYRTMYLETAMVLKQAVALYRSFGFEPTDEKHSERCDQAFFLNLQ